MPNQDKHKRPKQPAMPETPAQNRLTNFRKKAAKAEQDVRDERSRQKAHRERSSV